jgi:hypothetical protein
MIKIYDDGTGNDEVIIKATMDDIDILMRSALYAVGGMSEECNELIPQMYGVYISYLEWDCSIEKDADKS